MQWNIPEFNQWEELRPYVDTGLLPLYLYRTEIPLPEQVLRMTYLMNVATAIEQRLKGRVLLFPLVYQVGETRVTLPEEFPINIVLQFSGQSLQLVEPTASKVFSLGVGDEDLESELRFQVTVDVLYQEILKFWKNESGNEAFSNRS